MKAPYMLSRHRFVINSFCCLCIALVELPWTAYPTQRQKGLDHLVPNEGLLETAYLKLLHKKLYVTPANYGRIAVLPSAASVGETLFSFHSVGKNAEHTVITYTKAKSNLWSEAHALNVDLTVEPQVDIQRGDVPFPKALATTILETIGGMLRNVRKLEATGRIVVDGTDLLVSLESGNGGQQEGILIPECDGRNSAALRRLGYLLDKYCNAKNDDRVEFQRKIEGQLRQFRR